MSITEQVQQILETEDDRKDTDSQFRKAIETIDSMKQQGFLGPTRYRLPPADTIGRRLQKQLECLEVQLRTETQT